MTWSPLRCHTSILQSSTLVQASASLSMGRTRTLPWGSLHQKFYFHHLFTRVFTYICTCTYTRIHAHTYTHTCTRTSIHRQKISATRTQCVKQYHRSTYASIYICMHIHIYTHIWYVHNLQQMCCRCVSWCQRNICITHTNALVLRTPVLKCTQPPWHSLQTKCTYICTYTHVHTHTCAQEYTCAFMTPTKHAEGQLQNLCTNMHAHTYTHVYTCMRIPIHIHMLIYTYMHVCTHTYIRMYTHTYNMYICTYTSTPGTIALQGLREKPDLKPRKLRTSPLETVVPPPCDEICLTRNDGLVQKQTQPTAAHHTITKARCLDYNCSYALVRSRSTLFMAYPSCQPRRRPPETRLKLKLLPFSRVFQIDWWLLLLLVTVI